jgi:hypothetical protein
MSEPKGQESLQNRAEKFAGRLGLARVQSKTTQDKADDFAGRLGRGTGSAKVADSLVQGKPRREDERRGDRRLVDKAGSVQGPQAGPKKRR